MLETIRDRLQTLFGRTSNNQRPDVALVLSGGGARASYQAGVLSYVAETFPNVRFSVVTGVSAGAINAAHLANHRGTLEGSAHRLVEHWEDITTEAVYEPEPSLRLLWAFLRGTIGEEAENGEPSPEAPRGMLDTRPLRDYLVERLQTGPDGELTGIAENLREGHLKAAALVTTKYSTGQSVSFVQGRDFEAWERPNRVSRRSRLTVDHVMASASLPLMFPAIRIGNAWYGDGGIRLSAPLAPAIHLGADRLLVISTRYDRSESEASDPAVEGYPPPAQIIGMLMNAVFLDTLDQDTFTLRRVNKLIDELPERKRHGMRPVDLLTLRPSVDLGALAGEYEATLPTPLRVLTRGLGTDQTQSPDWLSMLLFEHDYVARLIDIGYRDAKEQRSRIADFLERAMVPAPRRRAAA